MKPLLLALALLLAGCDQYTTVEVESMKMCADQHGTPVLENGHYVRCQFRDNGGAK